MLRHTQSSYMCAPTPHAFLNDEEITPATLFALMRGHLLSLGLHC